jgi:hypothetical protein
MFIIGQLQCLGAGWTTELRFLSATGFFFSRSSPDRVWGLPSFMAVDTECLFPMGKTARTWFYFHLVSKLSMRRAVRSLTNTLYEAGTFGCKTIFYGSSRIKWCLQRLEFHYRYLSKVHILKFLRSTYIVLCPKSHIGFRLSSRYTALVLPTFCKFPALHIMRERERERESESECCYYKQLNRTLDQ